MRNWWRRTIFLIRHQLYLRVVSVIVLSILSVGLLSWHVLTYRAVRATAEHLGQQQAAQLAETVHRVTMRALLADLDNLESSYLARDGVCGVASFDAIEAAANESPAFLLAPLLDRPCNHEVLAAWWQVHGDQRRSSDRLAIASQTQPRSGPRLVAMDRQHALWLYPPILLASDDSVSAQDGEPAQASIASDVSVASIAVLPVAVRRQPTFVNADGDAPVAPARHSLILLDLNQLAVIRQSELVSETGVVFLLDRRGRLIMASEAGFWAGRNLASAMEAHPVERFTGLSSGDLAEACERFQERSGHLIGGSLLKPWLVVGGSRQDLPLMLITAVPVSGIHLSLLSYTALVFAMVLIAMVGSLATITRIGSRLSARVGHLSTNMAQVARGDYSIRMETIGDDEIEQLVGYFDQMAVSLHEADCDRREKTERLRNTLDNLKFLDRAKDNFLTLISHEVRTPLTAIMGGVEYLQKVLALRSAPAAEETPSAPPPAIAHEDMLEVLDIIASNGRRLGNFMNDAIQMTAIQTSTSQLDIEPVLLNELIAMAMCGVHERAEEQQLTIVNRLLGRTDIVLLCDRNLMQQAFEKLLDNAVRHNEPDGSIGIAEVDQVPERGGVGDLVRVASVQRLVEQPSFARWEDRDLGWRIIEIFNTGPAIPQDRQAALFGKLELVGQIEHHDRGSGLSLPIAKAAVEMHGGHIFLHARAGVGNSFYLLLPVLTDLAAAVVAAEALALQTLQVLPRSTEEQGHGVGSAAGHEEVDRVTDPTPLEVEL